MSISLTNHLAPEDAADALRADALAGLTTSFALLPECIAFALVAHLNPLMGLYGAFIICTLTALFGGRPGMVSGAAGSMAVVIVAKALACAAWSSAFHPERHAATAGVFLL